MSGNRTFTMIKPDAVESNNIGNIIQMISNAGFTIKAMKFTKLSHEQAKNFYEVHKERPFYNDLVKFMTSGPVVVQVLEGDNAVLRNRELMGATNPAEAEPGTIRREYAESLEANSVHGSDSLENAKIEIDFFFGADEIVG